MIVNLFYSFSHWINVIFRFWSATLTERRENTVFAQQSRSLELRLPAVHPESWIRVLSRKCAHAHNSLNVRAWNCVTRQFHERFFVMLRKLGDGYWLENLGISCLSIKNDIKEKNRNFYWIFSIKINWQTGGAAVPQCLCTSRHCKQHFTRVA